MRMEKVISLSRKNRDFREAFLRVAAEATKRKPGDVWKTPQGKFRAMNQNGVMKTLNTQESAKVFSQGPSTNLGSQSPKKILKRYTDKVDNHRKFLDRLSQPGQIYKKPEIKKNLNKMVKTLDKDLKDLSKYNAGASNPGKKRLIQNMRTMIEEAENFLRDS